MPRPERPSSTSSGFRYRLSLKAKYVPDPSKLQPGLKKQLKDAQFTIQMRNNMYTIDSEQTFELKQLAEDCGYRSWRPTMGRSPSNASSQAPSFKEIKVN